MTFMLSAICLEPVGEIPSVIGQIMLEPVVEDANASARAGFIPGLRRYFAEAISGSAFYLLVDEGNGYHASNRFFEWDDEGEIARLVVPLDLREHLEHALEAMLKSSRRRTVILVAEDNGHVTDPDLSPDEIETIDVVGPLSYEDFWRRVDLGEILEDSVITIQ